MRGEGRDSASVGHLFDAKERFEGAKEYAAGFAFALAGDVQAVVIAVDEVNVGVAGRAEEHGIAGGIAGGGVGSGIVLSEVSFDFDDAGGEAERAFADEDFAEKLAGYAARVAGEEGAGERVNVGRVRTSGVFSISFEVLRPCDGFVL